MGDIKLFHLDNEKVTELPGTSVELEKSLQEQIEKNLETFMGVRFLASEYSTGPVHGGRIDIKGGSRHFLTENGLGLRWVGRSGVTLWFPING